MTSKQHLLRIVVLTAFTFATFTCVQAQFIGQCRDAMGSVYNVDLNYRFHNAVLPQPPFPVYRDVSGQTAFYVPSAIPGSEFWITWENRLIQINQFGWRGIGSCNIPLPVPQEYFLPAPTFYAQSQVEVFNGGNSSVVNSTIPRDVFSNGTEFVKPPIVPTQNVVASCYSPGIDRNSFLDCVAPNILGDKEKAAYDCIRNEPDQERRAVCMLKNILGQNERRTLNELDRCYRQYGTNWQQYPQCMATTQMDPKLAQAVGCLQKSSQGGSINYWAMAACYAGPGLGLNTEATVALECAMASNGEPLAFVGCTGGRLTAMELDKCLTVGVGDNGCFGKNNTLTLAINNIGAALSNEFGENNDVVKAWKDITVGPGSNNDAVKTINNVAREAGRAGENVKREIRKVVPRIKIRW